MYRICNIYLHKSQVSRADERNHRYLQHIIEYNVHISTRVPSYYGKSSSPLDRIHDSVKKQVLKYRNL